MSKTKDEGIVNPMAEASLSKSFVHEHDEKKQDLEVKVHVFDVNDNDNGQGELDNGDHFTHFQASDFRFDRQSASVPPNVHSGTQVRLNKVRVMRFLLHSFIFIQLLFAIYILLCNTALSTHKEVSLSSTIELSVTEPVLRQLYSFSAFLVMIASFLGALSLHKHNVRLFMLFICMFILSILANIVTISLASSAKAQMSQARDNPSYLKQAFDAHFNHYNWTSLDDQHSVFINHFQLEFRCCGGEKGYHDWEVHTQRPSQVDMEGVFPFSCCSFHFSDLIVPQWCGYQQVEQMKSCPTAFQDYLRSVLIFHKRMIVLLLELIFIQILTGGIYFGVILRFEHLFHEIV